MAGLVIGAAAAVFVMDKVFGGGTRLSITNNIINDMTVRIAVENTTNCITQIQGTQEFKINSTDKNYPLASLKDANSNCMLCKNVLSQVYNERVSMESTLANMDKPYQTMSPSFVSFYNGGGDYPELYPCLLMCEDIVTSNIKQLATYQSTLNCSEVNSISSDISSAFKANIDSQLKNNQDIFGKVLGGLTKFNSSITNDLTNIMSSTVTTKLLQSIQLSTESMQRVVIGENGKNTHSVYINNASQSFSIKQVGELKVVNNVIDQIRQSTQYSILQDLLNKNDTIGDLSNLFVGFFTVWGKFVNNVLSQIFLIFLMLLIMLLFYKSYEYTMTSTAMKKRREAFEYQRELIRETNNNNNNNRNNRISTV